MSRRKLRRDESGQAVTEYILVLFIVLTAFGVVTRGLADLGLTTRITKPIREDFAFTYKNGMPDARGYDDPGGPDKHPRVAEGVDGKNFKMFFNIQRRN